MDKWTKNISNKIDTFQNRLQTLLESPQDETEKIKFEVQRSPTLIASLSRELPQDLQDKAIILFCRLTNLFEAGLLLERCFDRWKPQAQFEYGKISSLIKGKDQLLRLPQLTPLQIRKTDTSRLIEKFDFTHKDKLLEASAFLLQPTAEYSFLLISSFPDLWLKEHLENTQRELNKAFADGDLF